MQNILCEVVMTKKCSGCQVVKPLDSFGKNKYSPDGKHHYCKECANARQKAKRPKSSPVNSLQDHIAQVKVWASLPETKTELEEYQETLAEVNKFIIQWKTRLQNLPMELACMDQELKAELELIRRQKEAALVGAKQQLELDINHYIEQYEQRKTWLENYIAQLEKL